MIKHLIWDVDGTLFDTYPAIVNAFLLALQSFGRMESASRVDSLARIGLSQCVHRLAVRHQISEEALGERFGEQYAAIPAEVQPPFDGVRTVCERLLANGGTHSIATHRARVSAERLLATHGMKHLFARIVGGDDGFPKKPNPEIFLAILRAGDLDRAETAAVGDRDLDIQAGKAAGLQTCLFHPGRCESSADLVFSDYQELLNHLEASWDRPATR